MGLEQYSKATRETAQSVVKSLHREIVLDAHCILENGEQVNIEVQKGMRNDDVMRTRFHAAALTAAYTPKGVDFSGVPQVSILYITEYDALGNGQTVTHVKRCMETPEGYLPVSDREDIFFANTAVHDGSEKSQLLQLFLREDAFEDERYPELSRAVRYFKQTEGGCLRVCKTVEDYAKNYAKDYAKAYGQQCRVEERKEIISRMLSKGKKTKEVVELTGASLEEVEEVEASMYARA